MDWAFNVCKAPLNVLWLCGPAGSGKSAISWSILKYFNQHHHLGAFIAFDQQGKRDENNPL
jgi:adenylylsulfate kinase-like enzyme